MRIGVVGLQGAVSEHIEVTRKACLNLGFDAAVEWIGNAGQVDSLDGIIIPGGESTTIGKLMVRSGIFEKVRERAQDLCMLGTCAGLIILAKEGDEQIERTGQPLLKLMDIKVRRNAFGRQRDSFEIPLHVKIAGEDPFPCVFIRAPAIERVWGDAEPIAWYGNVIVGALQRNMLAVAFHPELTDDTRIHEYFLRMCKR